MNQQNQEVSQTICEIVIALCIVMIIITILFELKIL